MSKNKQQELADLQARKSELETKAANSKGSIGQIARGVGGLFGDKTHGYGTPSYDHKIQTEIAKVDAEIKELGAQPEDNC